MNKYLLRCNDLYFNRINDLKSAVVKLYVELNHEDFVQHPTVKLLKTIQVADQEIIPQNPDQPQYRLKGELKKYRRYKQGLQRYRLFFCFSSQPPIIVYLYLNDELPSPVTLSSESGKLLPGNPGNFCHPFPGALATSKSYDK
jgi:mRNA-degrading endonuclease RelE of RelBE toxin-antitoxin system